MNTIWETLIQSYENWDLHGGDQEEYTSGVSNRAVL
jgi:hypothetical protein